MEKKFIIDHLLRPHWKALAVAFGVLSSLRRTTRRRRSSGARAYRDGLFG